MSIAKYEIQNNLPELVVCLPIKEVCRKLEISRTELSRFRAMYYPGYTTQTLRELYILGYIYRHWDMDDAHIAGELGVSLAMVERLRGLMN
jgi:hypothetical protein